MKVILRTRVILLSRNCRTKNYHFRIRDVRRDWRKTCKGFPRGGFVLVTIRDPFPGDVDNRIKPLLDSLKGVVIKDDAQVVMLDVRKSYGDYLEVVVEWPGTISSLMFRRHRASLGW